MNTVTKIVKLCKCGNDVTPNDENLPVCEECLLDYYDQQDYIVETCQGWD